MAAPTCQTLVVDLATGVVEHKFTGPVGQLPLMPTGDGINYFAVDDDGVLQFVTDGPTGNLDVQDVPMAALVGLGVSPEWTASMLDPVTFELNSSPADDVGSYVTVRDDGGAVNVVGPDGSASRSTASDAPEIVAQLVTSSHVIAWGASGDSAYVFAKYATVAPRTNLRATAGYAQGYFS